MDSRTEERVKDWDSRPFSDGYEDLRELADAEFSGAVETGSTTAFALNGRIVGVVGGDVESFEEASGTIYEAPHPSLPLLFAMREQGGTERAKYYTNDTPVSEADGTLTSGSFTGYVELSENVLSGDYYVVYYGGRSMSCAFVGNQEKLITDDEAFDRADDEVGIYTVWDVDIEVQEIPGDEDGADDGGEVTAAGVDATDAGGTDAGGTGAGEANSVGVDETSGVDSGDANTARAVDRGPRTGVEDDTVEAAGVDDAAAGPPVDDAEASTSAEEPVVEEAEPAADAGRREDAAERDAGRRTEGSERDAGRRTDSGGRTDRDGREDASGNPAGADRSADASRSEGTPDRTREDRDDHGTRPDERARDDSGRRATTSDPAETGRNATDDRRGSSNDVDDEYGGAMAEVPDEVMAEVEDEARADELADEVAWRETTTIPSINPDRTTDDDDDEDPLAVGGGSANRSSADDRAGTEQRPGGGTPASSERDTGRSDGRGQSGARGQSDGRGQSGARGQSGGRGGPDGPGRTQDRPNAGSGHGTTPADSPDPERVSELEDDLASVREERDAIATERDELERERDQLADRNEELQARVSDLESEVADLEAELATARERLENAGPGVDPDSVDLAPREALEGTNLFVRYGSKSGTTLEDVHDRDVTVADLEANLRLEYHTGFDAGNAVVDGRPYDEFLYDSTPYQFVEWFVYDLVFEIRDTGNESGLGDLYEAFPKVDRIELYGDVSLRYEEDGEEHREQTTFDVVVRDRMGNPLAVAKVNSSRDPATEQMMVDLQEHAARVKRTSDALAGAFMVTTSFFAPEALEIAEEATSGGLLSRDSKKSYVKLSRKRGYHLGLVETRNGDFHVNVPEL